MGDTDFVVFFFLVVPLGLFGEVSPDAAFFFLGLVGLLPVAAAFFLATLGLGLGLVVLVPAVFFLATLGLFLGLVPDFFLVFFDAGFADFAEGVLDATLAESLLVIDSFLGGGGRLVGTTMSFDLDLPTPSPLLSVGDRLRRGMAGGRLSPDLVRPILLFSMGNDLLCVIPRRSGAGRPLGDIISLDLFRPIPRCSGAGLLPPLKNAASLDMFRPIPRRSGGGLPMSPLLRGLFGPSLELFLPIPRPAGGGLPLKLSLRGFENCESLDVARPREVGGGAEFAPSDFEGGELGF